MVSNGLAREAERNGWIQMGEAWIHIADRRTDGLCDAQHSSVARGALCF